MSIFRRHFPRRLITTDSTETTATAARMLATQ
jgi:hypothetical protein